MVFADSVDSVDAVWVPVGKGLEENAASSDGEMVGVVDDASSLIGENLRVTMPLEVVRVVGMPSAARSFICSLRASFSFLNRSRSLLLALCLSFRTECSCNSSSSSIDMSSLLASATSLSCFGVCDPKTPI
jgi:hypothetical protein